MDYPERENPEPDVDHHDEEEGRDPDRDDVPGGDILPEGRPADPDEGGLP